MRYEIEYKVGYNFDTHLVDEMAKLNAHSKFTKIKSAYASLSEFDWLTARPKYRLPNVTTKELKKHIELLHSAELKFFYALNAPYIGKKTEIESKYALIVNFIKKLEDAHVDGVIITHPLLAELVKNSSQLEIAVSSIVNIFSVSQMEMWRQLYGANIFCLSPYLNRQIGRLIKMQERLSSVGGDLELIVNELCGLIFPSGTGCSPCIYRESCFTCHSENITKDEEKLVDGYPQFKCITNRSNIYNCSFWSKLRFIRPEDILKYADIGIRKFKITGRTAKTEELVKVLRAYMELSFDGDISSLWYLENKKKTISNKSLENMIDFWFINKGHNCDDEICGVTCKYCDDFIKNTAF